MSDITPGRKVILKSAPAALLLNLPEEDQRAIQAIVGKPVDFAGYSFGQAEIEFVDAEGDGHTIWVEPAALEAA